MNNNGVPQGQKKEKQRQEGMPGKDTVAMKPIRPKRSIREVEIETKLKRDIVENISQDLFAFPEDNNYNWQDVPVAAINLYFKMIWLRKVSKSF